MRTTLLLDIAADAFGERLALGTAGTGLTYARLRSSARAVAAWLRRRECSMQPVERVAFVGLNGNALPLLLFASGYAGKTFVPLNYRLTDGDLRKLVERTAPSIVIIDDDMMERLGKVRGIDLIARSEFEALHVQMDMEDPADIPDGGDIAMLLFTSGTSGEPKAAILRHQNLTAYVMATVELLGSDESEAALVSVPPYHIAGISAILTSTYGGRRIMYLPAFTAEAWVEMVVREKISHAMVVPTMLDRILDVMEKTGEPLPHLKALSYGGGRMPEAVIARALLMLPHVDFINAYGLTETSSTIALLDAQDHRAAIASNDPRIRRRLASVGQPLPSVELEIRGADGTVCAPEVPGEIYVRGDQVSGEYVHRNATTDSGWFPTNDAGWLDADGYLFVEGRLDDLIVRGGENISPGEIEDILRRHPAVADVAVLGLHDDQWGERVAAVVVPQGSQPCPQELAAHVKAQLRSTKTPESWFFRDALPYNETGKLLRRVLKEELANEAAAG